jgi:GNAT superfamily N-acetyltransferase
MLQIVRTTSANSDFLLLVKALDQLLAILDGEDHAFYAQFNKVDALQHVLVAYEGEMPVGCGAIKKIGESTVEVKRMFVDEAYRNKGIASTLLAALEDWAIELGNTRCLLETGIRQPEAIALYKKNGYRIIENYGQYAGVATSVCFEKELKG